MGAPLETPPVGMARIATIGGEYLGLTAEQHGALVELYRARLCRLLHTPVEGSAELARQEQVCLRSRGLLNAVRTLTWLGEGEAASALLRAAPHN